MLLPEQYPPCDLNCWISGQLLYLYLMAAGSAGLLLWYGGRPLIRWIRARWPRTEPLLTAGRPVLASAWWVFAIVCVLLMAWETRYRPIVADGVPMAWDRWTHRYCVLERGHWQCGVPLTTP